MIAYIENDRFRVGAKSVGAELTSFSDGGTELLWQGSEIWNGQSPLLFPVVGRLREDTYCLGGETYVIPKHGFARKAEFALEHSSKDEMTFLMTDSAETLKCFPFPFELRVHYFFTEGGFVMEHRVKNTGDRTMYFSIGAHPAFQCAMGDRIVMDETETAAAFRLDDDKLRAQEQLPVFDHSREVVVTADIFAEDALIFDGLKSKGCTVTRANGRTIHVDFGGAPCLGMWAKPAAPYVCIEPWYGVDDMWNAGHDFTKKERICALEVGEEFVFPVTITTP
jgi:galactose mutarotase-like enzyme